MDGSFQEGMVLKKSLLVCVLASAALALLPAVGFCHSITNIVSTPLSPASVSLGEHIDYTFDYETDNPGGVLIFVRVSNLTGNPDINSHGSPIYPVGTGSGTGYFYCTSGPAEILEVRVHMTDPVTSEVLAEEYIPVHFEIGSVGDEPTTFSQIKGLFR